jgi:hypothetical protein
MVLGICEIHRGAPTEIEHIQFCGDEVRVCLSCLQNQTGVTTKAEFQDIEDDRFYELKHGLLEAAGHE